MPVVIAALLLVLLIVLASIVLVPITLIQRYRAGTARRRARPWLAVMNVVGVTLSILFFIVGVALASVWVPSAIVYACGGLLGGVVIGMLGLVLTRWDVAGGALHYTPSRWLVLAITLAVTGRITYGLWRSWEAWRSFSGEAAWIAASGVAGALAAAGVILGYYFAYWLGIAWRAFRSHNREITSLERKALTRE